MAYKICLIFIFITYINLIPLYGKSINESDTLSEKRQQIVSGLYISPDGDDNNNGYSPEYPLKHINYAISIIQASKEKPGIIYLGEGIYSPDTTEEKFPINVINNIIIKGQGVEKTILDAQKDERIFLIQNISGFHIEGMMIKNAHRSISVGILQKH